MGAARSATNPETERRRHLRFGLSLAVQGGPQREVTSDVSLGGVRVVSPNPPPIGSQLTVALDFGRGARQATSDTTVRVVRRTTDGYGAEFVKPPPVFMQELRKQLQTLEAPAELPKEFWEEAQKALGDLETSWMAIESNSAKPSDLDPIRGRLQETGRSLPPDSQLHRLLRSLVRLVDSVVRAGPSADPNACGHLIIIGCELALAMVQRKALNDHGADYALFYAQVFSTIA